MTPKGQYYQVEMPVSFVPFTEYVLECVVWKWMGRCLLCVRVFASVGLAQQHSFTLFLKAFNLFLYGWAGPLWLLRLSLVVESRGLLCSRSAQAHCSGFSSWRAWAPGRSGFRSCAHALSCAPKLWSTGSRVVPRHVGSSWIRDQTPVSCIGRWTLYHWATRKAQYFFTLDQRGIPYALFIH